MRRLLALGALLLATTAAASRPDAPDFSGRWLPVLEEWHGIERMLEIQEASWIVRQAFGRVAVAEVITQSGDELRIAIDAPIPLHSQHMHLDGVERDVTTPLGKRARARHFWREDGVLVSTVRLLQSDGSPYTVTVHRSLSGDATLMELDIRVDLPDGAEHRARQVYRRERSSR